MSEEVRDLGKIWLDHAQLASLTVYQAVTIDHTRARCVGIARGFQGSRRGKARILCVRAKDICLFCGIVGPREGDVIVEQTRYLLVAVSMHPGTSMEQPSERFAYQGVPRSQIEPSNRQATLPTRCVSNLSSHSFHREQMHVSARGYPHAQSLSRFFQQTQHCRRHTRAR